MRSRLPIQDEDGPGCCVVKCIKTWTRLLTKFLDIPFRLKGLLYMCVHTSLHRFYFI